MQKTMYTPFFIGNKKISNRLVASAMFEYGADNGKITEKIKNRYFLLSNGGCGLIITGMQAVSASGAVAPIMVNTEYDGYIKDMKSISDFVHKNGCKIIVQFQHCGAKTSKQEGYDRFDASENKISADCVYHEMTKNEIEKLVSDFAKSALRCKKAGVDGVQIHAAHGFLINSFLSPSSNRRNDEYGGKIENRARILFEIYNSMRQAAGDDFIIGVKFPFCDLNKKSIKEQESLTVLKELEKGGMDFIEISSGMKMDNSSSSFVPVISKENQAPFLKYASKASSFVNIPVISVCGYRTVEMVEKTLKNTEISAISFGRPLVREPNLFNRWKKDESPAKCISCNQCCNSFKDGIITCQVEKTKKALI